MNGNGTRTTSPILQLVVSGIVGVVPDFRERFLRDSRRSRYEAPIAAALAEKVDEVLDFGELVDGQIAQLLDQGFGCCVHFAAPAVAEPKVCRVFASRIHESRTQKLAPIGSAAVRGTACDVFLFMAATVGVLWACVKTPRA